MGNKTPPRPLLYGVVKFVKGRYADSLGYYDNDSDDGKAVVYLGIPLKSKYVIISHKYLRSGTPDEEVEYEMSYTAELDPKLRQHMGI